MREREITFESVMLTSVSIIGIVWLMWLLTGCGLLTQRTARVTYVKGCAITVEGVEVQKAAETAREISMKDCEGVVTTIAK